MEIAELKVTPDKYLTVRYAGASGDFNPIHIDEEFAKAVGLPGRILHGLYTMAQVARAQTEAAGGPQALRRLSVQFRGMGLPEQEITVTSTVESEEGGVVVVACEATQAGKRIIRNARAELVDPVAEPAEPTTAAPSALTRSPSQRSLVTTVSERGASCACT